MNADVEFARQTADEAGVSLAMILATVLIGRADGHVEAAILLGQELRAAAIEARDSDAANAYAQACVYLESRAAR